MGGFCTAGLQALLQTEASHLELQIPIRLSAMKEAGKSGLSRAARPTLDQKSSYTCTVRDFALAATRTAPTQDASMRMETVGMACLS